MLSRASGQEKSTEAYFGLNLISDPKGRPTILSHATASREWKLVRKAVAPAFSQAAMKAGFESAIRPSAEAAADALARACDERRSPKSSSSSKGGGGGGGDGAVSVNVDDLAAATAMDVITAFGFGVRSNAVERLGAELAEREMAKKREEEKESSGGGGAESRSSLVSSGSPAIPVPAPLIPGAEHTVEAMHAATEAAELYVFWFLFVVLLSGGKKNVDFFPLVAPSSHLTLFLEKNRKTNRYVVEPWRAWTLFRLSEPVRRGQAAMATVRACIDAVLAAAGEREREREASGSESEETIFSRLRAVAPAVAALDPTEDPAACLRREAGLLYFAGIGE